VCMLRKEICSGSCTHVALNLKLNSSRVGYYCRKNGRTLYYIRDYSVTVVGYTIFTSQCYIWSKYLKAENE